MQNIQATKPQKTKIENNGLCRIYSKGNWKIPSPQKIAKELLTSLHEYLMHFGTDKLYHFANQLFKMKNLSSLAREISSTCDLCQKAKYYNKPVEGEQYFDIPSKPKELVSVDIFGPITPTKYDYKYIIVIEDIFSKYTKLYPLKQIRAQSICNVIQKKYTQSEVIPKVLLSDQAKQFLSEEWELLRNKLKCKVRHSTPIIHNLTQ